jgi:hypothetical protein
VLRAPGDSCQLRSAQSLLIRRSAQSLLIQVSSACECVDFSGASSLGWLLCSPLDCSAASPRRLNQLQSAQSLFLLISICCVAGLLSSSESVPIFFPAHARRIPRSQTKASPVFPAASICATEDLARAPRFTRCKFLVRSSASWSRSFVFLLALRPIDLSLVVSLGIPNLVKLHAGGLPISFLSRRIKRLEDSLFKSLSRGDFSNTPTGWLVKCL